jgi:carboxyl-terminal processing protease
VQEPFQLPDGSGIRLTIARYYTPTGRSIQKPYNKGSEDYFYHMYTEPGIHESESPDSPGFLDSLKFMSPGGKILYGGGGIMPDVYLPVDTSGISTYFMNTRPLIYMFSLKYTENNRDVLRQFTDTRELEKFLDKQALLDKFVLYAAENRIKPDPEGIRISGNIIHTQLKAYITRNILDNNGFYPIWQKIDNTLLKAINILAEK